MQTKEEVANAALSEIGTSRVVQLDPPKSPLERHVARNFDMWKRAELTKHIWVFARELNMPLSREETRTGEPLPHVFHLPSRVLRLVRRDGETWEQEGRRVRADTETLSVYACVDVEVSDFDPLFVQVLSWRIAAGSTEFVTQSNTKTDRSDVKYRDAVAMASKRNSIIKPPMLITNDDNAFDWLVGRGNHGL